MSFSKQPACGQNRFLFYFFCYINSEFRKSFRLFLCKDNLYCSEQYFYIQQQRIIPYIHKIKLHFVFWCCRIISHYLSKPSNTWFNSKSAREFRSYFRNLFYEFRPFRSWTNHAHIPIKTFKNCGISSILVALIILPSFVILGSCSNANTAPVYFSASIIMLRNLTTLNSLPFSPERTCLYKIGPLSSFFIITAAHIANGSDNTRPIAANTISIALFIIFCASVNLKLSMANTGMSPTWLISDFLIAIS